MNTHPVTEHTEATSEQPALARTEVMTNDYGEGKEGMSPAPTLVMVNADDTAACTGNGCVAPPRKG